MQDAEQISADRALAAAIQAQSHMPEQNQYQENNVSEREWSKVGRGADRRGGKAKTREKGVSVRMERERKGGAGEMRGGGYYDLLGGSHNAVDEDVVRGLMAGGAVDGSYGDGMFVLCWTGDETD